MKTVTVTLHLAVDDDKKTENQVLINVLDAVAHSDNCAGSFSILETDVTTAEDMI